MLSIRAARMFLVIYLMCMELVAGLVYIAVKSCLNWIFPVERVRQRALKASTISSAPFAAAMKWSW